MSYLLDNFKLHYHYSKFHLLWTNKKLYIVPKFQTDILSVMVEFNVPFIDYTVTKECGHITNSTSFGVLTWIDIIGELT